MNFVKAVIFLAVVAVACAGGYILFSRKMEANQIADIKKMCVQYYNSIQQSTITDVDEFCECTALVARAGGPEQIKAGGKACLDKFGKANLLKSCEAISNDMVKQDPSSKGVNCECVYDKTIDLFSGQAAAQSGADNLTMEQRRATVAQAFDACKKTE